MQRPCDHAPHAIFDPHSRSIEIDWMKNNPDWENVCIIANSVVSNRQARVATRAYIKEKLGLSLTEVEKRSRTRFDCHDDYEVPSPSHSD
jgi:hypothetical protein